MKTSAFFSAVGLCISLATAVDLKHYEAGTGVEAGFASFLKELYAQTEDPASTDTFTDFFPTDGVLIVHGTTATGAAEIVKLKQQLLPTAGNKHWSHFPNTTTVASETADQKVYNVNGVIQSTFDGGNCSQAYYQTHFTVKKSAGAPLLTPHSGSLLVYDDYVVTPSVSPTDIACDQ
ncbi:hypothetical protein MPH_04246 [Macrophomina phaseolina MS6]|uniref:SnoaL-like domain-containing protein n=1 Tax=Macrophomina phaseolina (strain MS6) TaxID=1126212 RepID=K2S7T3_MACPH|nr:hypothetical protein MPH_04246 [Macrophomina phaseolina MS6]